MKPLLLLLIPDPEIKNKSITMITSQREMNDFKVKDTMDDFGEM